MRHSHPSPFRRCFSRPIMIAGAREESIQPLVSVADLSATYPIRVVQCSPEE
jgi:hypothetical protein